MQEVCSSLGRDMLAANIDGLCLQMLHDDDAALERFAG